MVNNLWHLKNGLGKLSLGSLQGCLEVAQLSNGLNQLILDNEPLTGSLWQIALGDENEKPSVGVGELREVFQRGHDLFVSHTGPADKPYRTSIYWRAEFLSAKATHATLSLIISVETDTLGSQPLIEIQSNLAANEAICLKSVGQTSPHAETLTCRGFEVSGNAEPHAPVGILYRLPGGQFSLLELTHPTDFRSLCVKQESGGTWSTEWKLLGQFLEKGVIRRARLQATILPRRNDINLAVDCCSEFTASEIPLST
jgi:hypothetical protein